MHTPPAYGSITYNTENGKWKYTLTSTYLHPAITKDTFITKSTVNGQSKLTTHTVHFSQRNPKDQVVQWGTREEVFETAENTRRMIVNNNDVLYDEHDNLLYQTKPFQKRTFKSRNSVSRSMESKA